MSEYTVATAWSRSGVDFQYESYPRGHSIHFGSGAAIAASAAPEYHGDADRVNPEETFLAALSSCHMLTFLAIAAKRGLIVDSYTDAATCFLEKDADDVLCVTRAELHPAIVFSGATPTAEELVKLHASAHRNCFIARSVKTKVSVHPG
jgi:organic hydroperoxide reductase OsmC/OhrA